MPGDTADFGNRWWEEAVLGARVAELDPFSASMSVAGVVGAFFIAFAFEHTKTRAAATAIEHARAALLDNVVSAVFLIGSVLCWLLVQLPTGGDPRALNVLGPVCTGLLCAALGALSTTSAEAREVQEIEAELQDRNLQAATEGYASALGQLCAGELGDTLLRRCRAWLRVIPMRGMILVVGLWGVAVLTVVVRHGADLGRIVGVLALCGAAQLMSVAWVDTTADKHVSRLAAGRNEWGSTSFALWLPIVLLLLMGALLVFVQPLAGVLIVTFALTAPVAGVICRRNQHERERYLRLVQTKLAGRVATLERLKKTRMLASSTF